MGDRKRMFVCEIFCPFGEPSDSLFYNVQAIVQSVVKEGETKTNVSESLFFFFFLKMTFIWELCFTRRSWRDLFRLFGRERVSEH